MEPRGHPKPSRLGPGNRVGAPAPACNAVPLSGVLLRQDIFSQSLWKTLHRAEATLLRGWGRRSGGQAFWFDYQERPRQHFLYFLPLPQGQGSFRPTFLLWPRKDGCSLARPGRPSWLSKWL